MGFFGTFCYKKKVGKKKEKWYVHIHRGKGRKMIYYMDKIERDAIDLPPGYEVIESPKSGIPMLRKKTLKKKEKE
jgi:hypothetical protein